MSGPSPGTGATDLDGEDVVLMRLVAEGRTTAEVARRTGVSERTVRRRLRGVCDTLGVGTAIEAVVILTREQLI